MDLSLSEEQAAFVTASRRMLDDVCPPDVVADVATPNGPGHSVEVWQALTQAGWLGMPFPAQFGGAEAALFDLGLAYREAGRALVPTTLYSTIAAGLFITNLGTDEQRKRWLSPICRGELVGAVAVSEPHAFENFDLLQTTAMPVAEGWVLNGQKAFVANAEIADVTLVLARIEDGNTDPAFGIFVVPRDMAGVKIDPYLTFGQDAVHEFTLAHCRLPGDALLGDGSGTTHWRDLCEETLFRVRALHCMEMLGGIEAVLDRTVTYVKERHQFGVPIGSFQAVQHHLANIAMPLEAGRIAAFRALWAASDRNWSGHDITVAEIWLCDTYVQATLTAHQLWGGMGYALEGHLYLWSQRAKTLDLLCGRRATRLERLLVGASADSPASL